MHTSGAWRREIANEYLRLDTALVPRMLRSAISAFTRVFDALCLRRDGLLVRGLWLRNKGMGPDRDRGESHDSSPPTPPYVRVRIRRFDGLSMLGGRDGC